MRTPIALLSSVVALALSAATAVAQERPAPAPAATPAAPMPMDCKSGGMKRHDHGAERNVPSVNSMPCASAEAASGAKAKTKPVHDHGKVHKNQ